jgi:hypothetical protein
MLVQICMCIYICIVYNTCIIYVYSYVVYKNIPSIFAKRLKSKPAMTWSAKLCTSGPCWAAVAQYPCWRMMARGRTIQFVDIIEDY